MGFVFVSFVSYSSQAPEITLQIASHLPATEASDNAFQGSFFYQVLKIEPQVWGSGVLGYIVKIEAKKKSYKTFSSLKY